ncbi:unnamed protein product [Debaryomyces tyrocola]|nr:unnamed protein product [Debaryomyces tyrocola]
MELKEFVNEPGCGILVLLIELELNDWFAVFTDSIEIFVVGCPVEVSPAGLRLAAAELFWGCVWTPYVFPPDAIGMYELVDEYELLTAVGVL